jgi:hypothetical protein
VTALLATFWPYVAGAVAAILAFVGVYAKGRRDASQKAAQRRADEYIKTNERMRNADNDDRSADAVDKRLRDLSK